MWTIWTEWLSDDVTQSWHSRPNPIMHLVQNNSKYFIRMHLARFWLNRGKLLKLKWFSVTWNHLILKIRFKRVLSSFVILISETWLRSPTFRFVWKQIEDNYPIFKIGLTLVKKLDLKTNLDPILSGSNNNRLNEKSGLGISLNLICPIMKPVPTAKSEAFKVPGYNILFYCK